MSIHRIGIISDTHGLLRPEVVKDLSICEAILHGGDINTKEIVESLNDLSQLYIVRGNNDKEWASNIPMSLEVSLFGFTFYMCHKKSDIAKHLDNIDFVIYGHSHKYEVYEKDGVTFINPGSCGPRRFHQPITYCILKLDSDNHTYEIEKRDISPVLKSDSKDVKISEKDLNRLVSSIIKDMSKGKTIAYIAKTYRVDEELVDNICRMYSTHQGISVAGIIDKLEIRKADPH